MTRLIAGFVTPKVRQSKSARSYCAGKWAMSLLGTICLMIGMMTSEVAAGFPFPRPSAIEPNVKFWVDVFATYSERDFIVVDRAQVWRIYQVLHLPGDGTPTRSEIDAVND